MIVYLEGDGIEIDNDRVYVVLEQWKKVLSDRGLSPDSPSIYLLPLFCLL